MPHILVVDDDAHIVDVITFALEKAGHTFEVAKNGSDALGAFSKQTDATRFDFVILDVGMPEIDGLEVCREIRKQSDVPILFLSARDEEIDRVLGLEIGGDDYVTKPFSPRELITRIGVILKRTAKVSKGSEAAEILSQGLLKMDADHRSVQFDETEVKLTGIEFSILKTLLMRPRMAFTREQILNTAWPSNIHVSDRTIDSHVRNLRAKLMEVGCGSAVETVHGIGFRLGNCDRA